MTKSATIRDVARVAGVSVSVVSRVLNPGSGPVAGVTREKVVEAIEQLAYHPRAAAKELSRGRALTIGLVLADLTNPFFARLADLVVWEARARGVQVVLMTTREDSHLEAETLETLLDRSVGGVIVTPTGGNVEKWSRLRQVGVDVVFVDRTISALPEIDLVSIENTRSTSTATEHLLGLGHSRIAIISGPASTSTGRSRIAGYDASLRHAGIIPDPVLVRDIPFRGDAGGDAVAALLGLPNPPTALIVANTAQVLNVMRRLSQMKVAIPSELSVIVFDDNPWIELMSPPLSSVRQPIDMLARHSVELVLARMRGQLPPAQRTIHVQAEFIARESCARLASVKSLPSPEAEAEAS